MLYVCVQTFDVTGTVEIFLELNWALLSLLEISNPVVHMFVERINVFPRTDSKAYMLIGVTARCMEEMVFVFCNKKQRNLIPISSSFDSRSRPR